MELLAVFAVLLPVTVIVGFGLLLHRRVQQLSRRLVAAERAAHRAVERAEQASRPGQASQAEPRAASAGPEGLPTRRRRNGTVPPGSEISDEAVQRAAAELSGLVTKLARIAADRPGSDAAARALGDVRRRIDRLRGQLREGSAGGTSLVTPRVPTEPATDEADRNGS